MSLCLCITFSNINSYFRKCDKLKNPKCNQTKKKSKCEEEIISKTQNGKEKKLKMWQNSKTPNVTKLQKSKCDKTQISKRDKTKQKCKCDKTQKLKI